MPKEDYRASLPHLQRVHPPPSRKSRKEGHGIGHVIGLANHTVLRNTNGTLIPIQDSAAPIRDGNGKLIGVVLVFRDATHERKSQEVLRKTEKLAAAARLSATVAHEINNPLEAIGNLLYIAKGTPGVPVVARTPAPCRTRGNASRTSPARPSDSTASPRSRIGSNYPLLSSPCSDSIQSKLVAKNITVARLWRVPPDSGTIRRTETSHGKPHLQRSRCGHRRRHNSMSLSCMETPAGKVIQVPLKTTAPGSQ